jgi:hypothetical protein
MDQLLIWTSSLQPRILRLEKMFALWNFNVIYLKNINIAMIISLPTIEKYIHNALLNIKMFS